MLFCGAGGMRNQDTNYIAGTAFMYHRSLVPTVEAEVLQTFLACAARPQGPDEIWRCTMDQYLFFLLHKQKPQLFYRIGMGWGALVRILYRPLPPPSAAFLLDPICATDRVDCQGFPRVTPPPRAPLCLDEDGLGRGPVPNFTFAELYESVRSGENYQCWRDPPCVSWAYLTPKRCLQKTARSDPRLVTEVGASAAAKLFGAGGVLAGRVLAVLGGGDVKAEAVTLFCAAARAGLPVHGPHFSTRDGGTELAPLQVSASVARGRDLQVAALKRRRPQPF